MKFGVNTFVWVSPFSHNHLSLIDKAAAMGFNTFEIAVEDPDLIDLLPLKEKLDQHKMLSTICGVFGTDRDVSSDDPIIRQAGIDYLHCCVDIASELNASVICGPMYACVGKARMISVSERQAERERAAIALQQVATYAEQHGIRLALELLNRFETDMLNTVEQGLSLIEDIDRPNVGLHLDTFHMHLEEKDSAIAIQRAGDRVFHVHASENDRGIPGTGQVHWAAIAEALKIIEYDGAIVIESFTPDITSIAQAVNLWRPIAPSQDSIARDGLAFLRGHFE
jgi:D-psicose/D-tagatose/L-ribulose 3-epimerase